VDVLTMNGRLDEMSTTETLAEHMRDLERLGELVASSKAAFGVRFDHVGERLSIVDERGDWCTTTGRCWSCWTWWPPRAGAAGSRCRDDDPGRRAGRALPRRRHRVDIDLAGAADQDDDRQRGDLAGDGRGGFVIPSSTRRWTGWRRSSGCSAWWPVPS